MKNNSVTATNQSPDKRIIENVTGVILAGGKSRRFGQNKALVKVEGTPLIKRVTGVMGALFKKNILITNMPHEYDFLQLPVYRDLIKGLGPIGGVFTALSVVSNEAAFIVACDMPYLNPELINHLVSLRNISDAIVPKVSWKIEPLHALYNKRCLETVKKQIDDGQYQINRLFDHLCVHYIREKAIRRFDPELKCFFNINTPHQLRRFKH